MRLPLSDKARSVELGLLRVAELDIIPETLRSRAEGKPTEGTD